MRNPLLYAKALCLFAFFTGYQVPVNGQAVNIPYFDDFEGVQVPFSDSLIQGSPWQQGPPAYGITTGAHSGVNAWDIELFAPYMNNSLSWLTTPFFDLSSNPNSVISFWQNRNVELNWDGFRIDYSLDSVNWFMLGYPGDPAGTNWYTNAGIGATGYPAWDGASAGWEQSSYNLTGLNMTSDACFRFIFASDPSQNFDGVSIDDFSIYPLPPKDAGVVAIQNFPFLTAGSTTSPFTITVKNFGSQAFNSFSVSYTVNNGAPVTVPSTFNLQPNSIVNLSVPGFLVPAGQFTVCAFTTLAGDSVHFNDTLCTSVLGIASATIPYTNDFESGPGDFTAYTNSANTSWQYGTPAYGITSSAHSGSNCWDINLTTPYAIPSQCELYSPMFDFTTVSNSALSFFQNRACAYFDGMTIRYSTDGGTNWLPLGYYQDPSAFNWYNGFLSGYFNAAGWAGPGSGWELSSFPLNFLSGTDSVIFSFVFAAINNVDAGISIDDISITIPSPVDAGVVSITAPNSAPAGTVVPQISVVVKNFGSQTLTVADIAYSINGGPPVTSSVTVNILPGALGLVTLTGYTVPNGTYSLYCYTDMAADGNHINDTSYINLFGAPVLPLPFYDNFDGPDYGWRAESLQNPSDNWHLGTPQVGIPNAPFSWPNCWDINLNGIYTGPSLCYLYSPWFDFTNAIHAELSFAGIYNTEAYWDGVRMEYCINGGPWLMLGIYGDPQGLNWYNQPLINSSGLPAWTGNSGNWNISAYQLDSLNIPNGSIVGFRFVFNADNVVGPYDGMAVDNFSLSIPLQEDAALTSIVTPATSVSSGVSTPVTVNLKNNGLLPITSIDLQYEANGNVYGPVTWTGSLLIDSIVSVTLPSFVPVTGPNDLIIYTTWSADINKFNDTLKSTVNGLLSVNIPYSIDFENGAPGWDVYASPFANTTWELGMPAFGATTGTHSGDSCWDVNLHTECGNLAYTTLYTPVLNFSNALNSRLSCWINYDTEPFADGFCIEYSTNGSNWLVLGGLNDTLGTNWYNTNQYNNQPGWTMNSQGWQKVEYNTSFLDGLPYVAMRFKFIADFAIASTGASMDDFSITNFTGIGETEHNHFHVYPSPVADILTIDVEENLVITGLQVTDAIGKKATFSIPLKPDQKTYTLNVSTLAPGIYFISVETRGGKWVNRFVKK